MTTDGQTASQPALRAGALDFPGRPARHRHAPQTKRLRELQIIYMIIYMPRRVSASIARTASQPPGSSPRPERVGVYLNLDATVVDWFRQAGPGYQARINEVLRQFVHGVTEPDHARTRVERAQALFEQFHAQCFWHMRRDLVKLIDEQKAIDFYMASQGWTEDEVRAQVLTPIEDGSILGTPRSDSNSIMCYQVHGGLTKDGKPIPGGNDIDQLDYEFAASCYPK